MKLVYFVRWSYAGRIRGVFSKRISAQDFADMLNEHKRSWFSKLLGNAWTVECHEVKD